LVDAAYQVVAPPGFGAARHHVGRDQVAARGAIDVQPEPIQLRLGLERIRLVPWRSERRRAALRRIDDLRGERSATTAYQAATEPNDQAVSQLSHRGEG
jgi:hypothetical protein